MLVDDDHGIRSHLQQRSKLGIAFSHHIAGAEIFGHHPMPLHSIDDGSVQHVRSELALAQIILCPGLEKRSTGFRRSVAEHNHGTRGHMIVPAKSRQKFASGNVIWRFIEQNAVEGKAIVPLDHAQSHEPQFGLDKNVVMLIVLRQQLLQAGPSVRISGHDQNVLQRTVHHRPLELSMDGIGPSAPKKRPT